MANAFLASGGDGFVSFKNGKNAETGPNDFEALVDYVKQLKEPIQPIIDGRIQNKLSTLIINNLNFSS